MKEDSYLPLRQVQKAVSSVFQETASVIEQARSTSAQFQARAGKTYQAERTQDVASLLKQRQNMQQSSFTLSFLAESMYAKNMLVSAFLGNTLLANRYIPAPAVLTYGDQVDVSIYNAASDLPRKVGWNAFINEIAQNPHNQGRINAVQIERQLPLLAAGLRLIDFPRLDDIRQGHISAEVFLPQTDVFLLVTDAEQPRLENVLLLLQQAGRLKQPGNVFFVAHLKQQLSLEAAQTYRKRVYKALLPYFLDQQNHSTIDLAAERVFFLDIEKVLSERISLARQRAETAGVGLAALEMAIVRYLTTEEKLAHAFEPSLKSLRSIVHRELARLEDEKTQLVSLRQGGPSAEREQRLKTLQARKQRLTELVKTANTTIYRQRGTTRTREQPAEEKTLLKHPLSAVSKLAAPKPAAPEPAVPKRARTDRRIRQKQTNEPDPLKVWLDTDEHLEFARQAVQWPDISGSVRSEIEERIAQIRRREADPHLYMAVVGEFSSGKSTFINALLREELLETSVLPTTAAQTQFVYSDDLNVTVMFKRLKNPLNYSQHSTQIWRHIHSIAPTIQIPEPDIQKCIQLLTAEEDVAKHVDHVTIHHSASFLADGISIIDTPGVNALNEQHARITYDLVEQKADSAVIMIPAHIPLASSLADFLRSHLKPILHRCIFVATQMDRIREKEQARVLENIRQRLTAASGSERPVTIYSCAAQAVLDMLDGGTPSQGTTQWNERFEELEEIFFQRLRQERTLSIAESLLRLLNQLFEQLDRHLRERWSSYELRYAALESEVIQDLEAFTLEQHDTYEGMLTTSTSQFSTRVENSFANARESAKTRIRQAIFAASDINALQKILNEQVGTILTNAANTVSQELQEELNTLAQEAEQIGLAFDEEFTKEYRRLRAVSGLLLMANADADRRMLEFNISNIVSPAEQLNQELNKKGNLSVGGGAVGGAVVGTFLLPGIGTFVGAALGGWLGSKFGPSLDQRKNDLWGSLNQKLDESFNTMHQAIRSKVETSSQELEIALEHRIDAYIARYKTIVDKMIQDQRSELAELSRLQSRIEQDRKEIERRRSMLQRKQQELARRVA